jgi:type I restriction enzyme S subunit
LNYVIGLPPLAEQHRIVAKVDELMALCDALKARIQDAQTTQLHLADAVVARAVAG